MSLFYQFMIQYYFNQIRLTQNKSFNKLQFSIISFLILHFLQIFQFCYFRLPTLSQFISLQTLYLNLNTYNYCLGQVRRYKMEQHSLADCLLQLKGKIQQEGNSVQTLLILDRIDSKLNQHLESHQKLLKSLTEKQAELKQITRKLKKTSNKLNRKSQEHLALKEELTRVNSVFAHKIEQLTSQSKGFKSKENNLQITVGKNMRKNKPKQYASQCQILKQVNFEEMSAQNEKLKARIEETQKILITERKERETLALQVQRLKEIQVSEDSQLIKDNSTDDAGSLRGDPFYFEDEVEIQVEEESETKSFLREENFLTQIWEYGQKMYRKLSLRN